MSSRDERNAIPFDYSGKVLFGTLNPGNTITRALESVTNRRLFSLFARITLAGAGNFRGVFKNPSNSGLVMVLYGAWIVNPLSASTFGRQTKNPTTGLPAVGNVLKPNLHFRTGGVEQSILEVGIDTDPTVPIGGGTAIRDVPIPPGRSFIADAPTVMFPGSSIGFNIFFAGAADSTIEVPFYEEPMP